MEEVCREFTGRIYQKVPLKSAVKKRIREKTIYRIEILDIDGKDVLLDIRCEAGTYIRMLCHHIGLALGVGAHMYQLRRVCSGVFSEEDAVKLQDLKDAYAFYEEGDEKLLRKMIMPMEHALSRMNIPRVVIKDTAVDAICNGADLAAPGILKLNENINAGDTVAIYTLKGELVGIGRSKLSSEDILRTEKGICIETEKVLMDVGTYPRIKSGGR